MHHLDHTGKLDPGQKECAHQNRIGINVTIDIMALYNVMSQDTRPTQVLKQVNASLKELYRCLAVSGGCCNEKRSAVLFCGLLREVIEHSTDEAASAPPLSRILDLERALSESLGCTDELFDTDVHKMDLVWAHEQILERTQQLNDQLDKFDSSNSKKSKKRSNRRTTISSEENSDVSMECTSDSDCDSTEDVSLSQKRTVSMRKCKDVANSRIQFNSGDSIQDSDGSLLECLDPDQSSDDEDAS
ncbi:unnamed protein product [Albugo candida]|uniref:Uncharacterized protein n=1 Tax=Albugo candida TaxID=65357 RepID=A0A024GVZ6_9STRA|nr:unnamed protein product [Albugo candida]|eukprot:CCI50760.1 unnamed protein product [Albugo candida]